MYKYLDEKWILVHDVARLVFENLVPANPYQSKTDLVNCALVCREWYHLASPFIYVDVGLRLDYQRRIPTLQVSKSPFAKSVRRMALGFNMQDLRARSDAFHFRGNANIGDWMINCMSLGHIITNLTSVNIVQLDFSLPLPYYKEGPRYFIPFNESGRSHSSHSLCKTTYMYLARVLGSLASARTIEQSPTPTHLKLRHPMRLVVQGGYGGVMDMEFRWKLHEEWIFPLLPRLNIKTLYLGVDWNMPFDWLQGMANLEHLIISQDYRKRYDYDLNEIIDLAGRLEILHTIGLPQLRLVGTWSPKYPRNLVLLELDIPDYPGIDIFLFFEGLAEARQLRTFRASIKLVDHYFGGTHPLSEQLASLKQKLERNLDKLRFLYLSTYNDDIEEEVMREDDYERSSNEDLILGASLWKESLGCLKAIRVFALGQFKSSKWSILDFVAELENLREIKICHEDGRDWGISQQLDGVTVTVG